MKYAEELFPKGSFPDQKTDGAYLDGFLANNLDIVAKRIIDDMHFLIIISGNDMVGNGKSTMGTHVGAYLTNKINELHGKDLTFTSKNVVFKGNNIEKTSFDLPKLSTILLDESDDLKEHAMKETTLKLKRYFRKCRQQNQILILITPSFFELSKFYALARSQMLINVKFYDDFRRGTFDFYGANSKKRLYLKGKKEWNYQAVKSDFPGMFSSSYVFFPELDKNIESYKRKKYLDMITDSSDKEEESLAMIEKKIKAKLFEKVYKNLQPISIERLSKAFGMSARTGSRYMSSVKELEASKGGGSYFDTDTALEYNNNLIQEKIVDDEEGDERV